MTDNKMVVYIKSFVAYNRAIFLYKANYQQTCCCAMWRSWEKFLCKQIEIVLLIIIFFVSSELLHVGLVCCFAVSPGGIRGVGQFFWVSHEQSQLNWVCWFFFCCCITKEFTFKISYYMSKTRKSILGTQMPLSCACHFEFHRYYSYFCQGQIIHSCTWILAQGRLLKKWSEHKLLFLFQDTSSYILTRFRSYGPQKSFSQG